MDELIGKRLAKVRKNAAMSQVEFSKKIGAHTKSVQRWEQKNAYPGGETLKNICLEFYVNINWLLSGEGDPYLVKPPGNFIEGQGPYKGLESYERSLKFGERLKLARIYNRLNVENAAKKIGVLKQDYIAFENGFIPNAETISALSSVFNCNSSWLIFGEKDSDDFFPAIETIEKYDDYGCSLYLTINAMHDIGVKFIDGRGYLGLQKTILEEIWNPMKEMAKDIVTLRIEMRKKFEERKQSAKKIIQKNDK